MSTKFSPSGAVLAAASSNCSIELWTQAAVTDPTQFTNVSYILVGTIPEHSFRLDGFDFSCDSRFIRTFSGFSPAIMEAWCEARHAETARAKKAKVAMDELLHRRETFKKEMTKRGINVDMTIANDDGEHQVKMIKNSSGEMVETPSIEGVGLGRKAELKIGPVTARAPPLPCATRYFDLRGDLQHRPVTPSDHNSSRATTPATDKNSDSGKVNEDVVEIQEDIFIAPSGPVSDIYEIIETNADRQEYKLWLQKEDSIVAKSNTRSSKALSFMSGKGKKKDQAKDGEPRIYTVPEPKYGGGKGMTLDILVRMRWATTASPAAPEALALLSNKITNEGNNSNDNKHALGTLQEGSQESSLEEDSNSNSGTLLQNSIDSSVHENLEPAMHAGLAVDTADPHAPRIGIIESVCANIDITLGFLLVACHSDGSLTLHMPIIHRATGAIVGQSKKKHLRAHGYGGVVVTFTAGASALVTAGRRDGALAVWSIRSATKDDNDDSD